MFSGKFQLFVECCWFDSSDLIQTQNNSIIEIDEAMNNYKRFFNLNVFFDGISHLVLIFYLAWW